MQKQKIKKTVKELREEIYAYNYQEAPYLKDWRRNPYTWLKCIFYIEQSAILVHLLLKTKIKPNTVSIVCGFIGIMGGVLLAIPNKFTIAVACAIFFTHNVLDWCDGPLARITGQTSVTGYVLDSYAGVLNDLGLKMGLGFYVAFKTGSHTFYYLIPLIPFFYAAGLKSYSQGVLFEKISMNSFITNRMQRNDAATPYTTSENIKADILGKYKKYYEYFSTFLDARARSVDFICFLILIEMFTSVSITWIIFIAFIVKGFILFLGACYIVLKKDWIEKSLEATMNNIKKSLKDNK